MARRNWIFEPLEHRTMLAAPEFMNGRVVGAVESSAITAASGITASRHNMDVLWTFNDSGDSRLFALNSQGEHLGTFHTGVTARDWEEIAVGPGPEPGVDYLYIADIGDNGKSRSSITVFRVAEPAVRFDQSPVSTTLTGTAAITLVYPEGPRDAETLLVDPASGDIYIVTKSDARSRIYRAAYPQSTSGTTTLTYEGQLTWGQAAGGSISPDGDEIVLKDLDDVFYYPRPAGTRIAAALAPAPAGLPYTNQPLGEGITFDAFGQGYFTNSEGTHEDLYYYERMAIPGDINTDGRVARGDAASLLHHLGRACGAACGAADVNGDGVVALADLALVQMNLGDVAPTPAPSPSAPAAVRDHARAIDTILERESPQSKNAVTAVDQSRPNSLRLFATRTAQAIRKMG
jgi:hypothetical protein